jgi:hypothetical protein
VVPTSIAALAVLFGGSAHASGMFSTQSLRGDFVIDGDGGFVASTPFAPEPLRLNVAIVGRLTFDGVGRAHGEWTIVFHNAVVPFNVSSHFQTEGTYVIEPNGRMFMDFEEFKVEPPADDDGVADGLVGFECYLVQRQQEARCILNSLISAELGPEPVTLPVSLVQQR